MAARLRLLLLFALALALPGHAQEVAKLDAGEAMRASQAAGGRKVGDFPLVGRQGRATPLAA